MLLRVMGLNNEGKKLCNELLKLFLKVGVRKPRKGHVATASVKNRYLEPKSEKKCILLREERAEADTGRAGGPHLVGKQQQLTLCQGCMEAVVFPFPVCPRLLLCDLAPGLQTSLLATLWSEPPPDSSWH